MSESFDRQLFRDYFEELWENRPFPWQERLAQQVVEDGWPAVIDLPTASGKTACIDIAVFALACGRGSRRIFFIVDRKVIVDEAFSRAQKLAEKLRDAKQGGVQEIANRLRELSGEGKQDPLHTCQLRGGVFRDESWVRSPLQPMVVASTVDQVGSRLLFRGYGIAKNSQPIHAGLIANDSLLLLDEAHCSKAFAQTLEQVQRYRGAPWGTEPSNTPFAFVEMTATPSRSQVAAPFRLDAADRGNEVLGQRLTARKMTRFVAVKAKTDDSKKLAVDLVREAKAMAAKSGVKRVAVMVNRVETARAVAEGLGDNALVTLVIGRMRPVDRTGVEKDLEPVHSGVKRADDDPLRFVVSTQCLEVGADLDFDALVTELASMDALLQRFGRLNRLGKLTGGAFGCIVAPAMDAKKPDPIYGQALPANREWIEPLFAAQTELDFGLEGAEDTIPRLWQALPEDKRREMASPTPICPVLWPAHLDALVQTSPRPVPEPAVEYFLHGKQNGTGEVSVVWRSELDTTESRHWEDIVALCPPVVGEALQVKIWALRAWMNGTASSPQIDVEGGEEAEEIPLRGRHPDSREILVWQGDACFATQDARRVRPGDTVILPAAWWPSPELGYAPPGAVADVGDEAFFRGRNAVRLRLHPAAMANWPAVARAHFDKLIRTEDVLWGEVQAASAAAATESDIPVWLKSCLDAVARGRTRQFTVTPYPGQQIGWVVESKKTLQQMTDESGGDERSRGEPVSLKEHTASVAMEAQRLAAAVLPPEMAAAVGTAARWHDTGKADERFQALLFGGDTIAARLSPVFRAKGEFTPQRLRKEQHASSGLPDGFRHELTSLLLAEQSNLDEEHRDLVLHLIASHHGYCRPFAPVVLDDAPLDMFYAGLTLTAAERKSCAAHVLDSGVAERFWRLTRRYGWWGLAYLEALLRLADWKVSSEEQRRRAEQDDGDRRGTP
jgi:CRISPR-associated endonuclease/helicase Cas3